MTEPRRGIPDGPPSRRGPQIPRRQIISVAGPIEARALIAWADAPWQRVRVRLVEHGMNCASNGGRNLGLRARSILSTSGKATLRERPSRPTTGAQTVAASPDRENLFRERDVLGPVPPESGDLS